MKLEANLGEKPLWSQLFEILSKRIETGKYAVGETLPSELQLMDEFGVSRITVRQAMDKLLSAEMISRKRGKGTVVLEKKDKISTVFQSSFSKLKEVQSSLKRKVVSVQLVEPIEEVKNLFQLDDNKKVIRLIRHGEGEHKEVLAVHISYINPIVKMDEQTDYSKSLYNQFNEYGFKIDAVTEEITASIINEEEKMWFETDKECALMNRFRKGFHNSIVVEYTISKYLGEGYTLFINNN